MFNAQAEEELEAEFNARYDYMREAYGPTAEDHADPHYDFDCEGEVYGPFRPAAFDEIPF